MSAKHRNGIGISRKKNVSENRIVGSGPSLAHRASGCGTRRAISAVGTSKLKIDVKPPLGGFGGWLAVVCLLACTSFLSGFSETARAQEAPGTTSTTDAEKEASAPDADTLTTMFRHAEWDRWWVSGQANFISQSHPSFTSPYQGKNSLTPEA
jgi:hypothetical protein